MAALVLAAVDGTELARRELVSIGFVRKGS